MCIDHLFGLPNFHLKTWELHNPIFCHIMMQLDGRIVPGDRILHVNQVRLEHASLDTAVQALKGKEF